MDKQWKIAVAGMGYVGLSNAVLLAQHNDVVAVDLIEEKVAMVNAGRSPIVDAELEAYLREKPLRLRATTDGEDAYRGAERIVREYGDASKGGMIKHVTFPDNFMQEMETTISQIVGLADDPKVKVIVVNDAVPGTTEAFRRIKEKRNDVICLSGSPHEDPNVISSISDFSAVVDSISRGYLIIHTAK